MKIGFLFECGPQGADIQVCEYLVRTFFPDIERGDFLTLDNKPNLLRECGQACASLIVDGCDRVIILWDLYPAWRDDGARPCRKEDREAIFRSLQASNVAPEKVALVCIMEELEAWLLADGRAVSGFLSTAAHPFRVADCRRPESQRNPKNQLSKYVRQAKGRKYEDRIDAIRIAQCLPDLAKLRKSMTFRRFEAKLTGND